MLRIILGLLAIVCGFASIASAQSLTISTVERQPFSMRLDNIETGFSIDLIKEIGRDLGREIIVERKTSFGDMLDSVANQEADLAAANISITAEREARFDFSHPIYLSGLQIMAQKNVSKGSVLGALWSKDVAILILIAFAVLFGAGMLMWRFERNAQTYFDLPAKEASFPAFWWALNLVVNGGFEERAPRTTGGRVFGTFLVIASLFFVSIFVANITALMTVKAIEGSINTVNDLYGRPIGTIGNSTAAVFLDARDMDYRAYDGPIEMFRAFEEGSLDAVVFDAPILAYYANTAGQDIAEMVGVAFKLENYGFVLPSNSPLVEEINQSLLRLREDGTYDALITKWFGNQ